jgi:IS5 family transposase
LGRPFFSFIIGLAKNRAQLFTLFALGNLFLVRRKLMG